MFRIKKFEKKPVGVLKFNCTLFHNKKFKTTRIIKVTVKTLAMFRKKLFCPVLEEIYRLVRKSFLVIIYISGLFQLVEFMLTFDVYTCRYQFIHHLKKKYRTSTREIPIYFGKVIVLVCQISSQSKLNSCHSGQIKL